MLSVLALACGPGDSEPTPEPVDAPDVPVQAVVPSFECTGDGGTAEQLVCSDPALARLDLRLDSVFQAALAVALEMPGNDGSELRAYQRGWIGGRDECWKADDVRACVVDAYRRRTAELQAEFVLVEAGDPVFFVCNDEPANEFVLMEMPTDPPTARIERGDRTVIGVRVPTASGVRYEAPFGVWFWARGDEATVAWPQDTEWTCTRRDPGGD